MPMSRIPDLVSRRERVARAVALTLSVVITASLVAGCHKKDKAATQTAAKVNKEEITVHQINFVLAQQRALSPEAAASASRQVLERLIDQELAVQKAEEKKIDRDARVVQQIEAARRDIIARAYSEKIGEGAPKPTPAEIGAYYDAHPALFSERRIYNFQEINVEATPDQIERLKKTAQAAKAPADLVAYLKASGLRFNVNDAIRGPEQIPLVGVDQIAKMKDGQSLIGLRPNGLQVLYVVSSRPQPVALPQATPAIEKFLLNERKRKLVADDLQALRGAARIEYAGDFAADAARSPYQAPASPDLPAPIVAPPASTAPATNAAPQVDVPAQDTAPASMPSRATLDQGLKGLK